MRENGSPAVDDPVVAVPLDDERPQVAPLAVAVGRRALGVPEERPEVVLADDSGARLPRVDREEAHLGARYGPGGRVGRGVERVVPDQGPEAVEVPRRAWSLRGPAEG